jgi:hypothetical protein
MRCINGMKRTTEYSVVRKTTVANTYYHITTVVDGSVL